MLSLARNPRSPVPLALSLLPRLSVRDLMTLSRDRNVAEPVRKAALRTYRIKHG